LTTFVDLLRAVNVSGRNKLPMADLRAALERAGYAHVETYVQSGNVVCDGPEEHEAAHAIAVHDVVAAESGLDVAVLTLTADRLLGVPAGDPFPAADPVVDPRRLCVTFLSRPVATADFEALALPTTGNEAAALSADGRLVYLWLPYGYGRTRLDNAWFERALGVSATTRNWRTVLALCDLAAERRRPLPA
jgi:uncharacterized protein (DUF1697 family)